MNRGTVIFAGMRRTNNERFEVIAAAKRLNLRVVVLGRSIAEQVKQYATEWHEVDTSDESKVLALVEQISKEHNVLGALSWTDLDLPCVASINKYLGLRGLTSDQIKTIRNKDLTRKLTLGIEGLSPKTNVVTNLEELKLAIREIGYPAVIKPTSGNGTKGTFVLKKEADLDIAINCLTDMMSTTVDPIFKDHGNKFLVEEYLTGQEVSVEVIVAEGITHIIGITDKYTTEPFPFEKQHVFPSKCTDLAKRDVQYKVVQLVKAIQCDNCTLHIEGKINNEQFKLIEVNGRPGGGYITTHLVPRSTGIDHVANIIKVAIGEVPNIHPVRKFSFSGIRFLFAERSGIYAGLSGFNDLILEQSGLDNVFTEFPIGTKLSLPPESFTNHRVACFMAHGNSYSDTVEILEKAESKLSVKIE